MTSTQHDHKLFIAAALDTVKEHGIAAVPMNTFTEDDIARHFENCKLTDDGGDNQIIYDIDKYSDLFDDDEGELS